jgi:hypothetical protein
MDKNPGLFLETSYLEDFYKRFEAAVKARPKIHVGLNGLLSYEDFLSI